MSKINLSTHDGAKFIAKQYLDNCTNFTATEKSKLLPIVKFNVGVTALNLSTVLAVKAVVLVLFAKFSAAVAIGVICYSLRQFSNKIINTWTTELGIGSKITEGVESVISTVSFGKINVSNSNILSWDDWVLLKEYLPLELQKRNGRFSPPGNYLSFNLDIHAGCDGKDFQLINCIKCWIEKIEYADVRSHLELFA